MDIQVLGCSGGVGPTLRTTSFLVNGRVLIDAGTGVCDLTTSEMRRIRHICLTHAHLDHVCGAAFMCDNVFDAGGAGVTMYASHESMSVLRNHLFNWQLWPDFSVLPSAATPTMRFETVRPDVEFSVAGVNLTPVRVDHTVPCVGYIVEQGGRAFAFTGDTATNTTFWDAVNRRPDIEAVIVEVSFPSRMRELAEASKHYTVETLSRDLEQLSTTPDILISHNKPGCEAEIRAELAEHLSDWNFAVLQRGDVIEV